MTRIHTWFTSTRNLLILAAATVWLVGASFFVPDRFWEILKPEWLFVAIAGTYFAVAPSCLLGYCLPEGYLKRYRAKRARILASRTILAVLPAAWLLGFWVALKIHAWTLDPIWPLYAVPFSVDDADNVRTLTPGWLGITAFISTPFIFGAIKGWLEPNIEERLTI